MENIIEIKLVLWRLDGTGSGYYPFFTNVLN
jgi:hypothetical protein